MRSRTLMRVISPPSPLAGEGEQRLQAGRERAAFRARVTTVQAAAASGDLADFGTLGCAQVNPTNCIVHIPSGLQAVLPDLYRLVLKHELAHCRGWVH